MDGLMRRLRLGGAHFRDRRDRRVRLAGTGISARLACWHRSSRSPCACSGHLSSARAARCSPWPPTGPSSSSGSPCPVP